MKKVFVFSLLASALLMACGDNENKKSETLIQTEQPSINAVSAASKSVDSSKSTSENKTQDSIDAAHGHSH